MSDNPEFYSPRYNDMPDKLTQKLEAIMESARRLETQREVDRLLEEMRDDSNAQHIASGDYESPLATQIGGGHYKDFVIQPVEFIHANRLGFIEGCIVKYVCRHGSKNGRQDLEKARHFIDMLIELEYGA
jgi:hypothetical protein